MNEKRDRIAAEKKKQRMLEEAKKKEEEIRVLATTKEETLVVTEEKKPLPVPAKEVNELSMIRLLLEKLLRQNYTREVSTSSSSDAWEKN